MRMAMGCCKTMHSTGLLCAFRRTHIFRRAEGDVRPVQIWSQRETASRRHRVAEVRPGATSFELDDKSLCGGEAARQYSPRRRSRNAEQRVTLSEDEGEGTSNALCEGEVSGDLSRTLRGKAAVKHRSEIDSRVFSNRDYQPGLGIREPMSKQPGQGPKNP